MFLFAAFYYKIITITNTYNIGIFYIFYKDIYYEFKIFIQTIWFT